MFVRAKTVKDNQYAYLVENVWVKGKVKQKVKTYLGRIISLPDNDMLFTLPVVDFSLPKKDCLRQLITLEFLARGFVLEKNFLSFKSLRISLVSGRITQDNKPVVLLLNGRYVYRQALASLLDFFEPETNDDVKGKKLAIAFSDVGINISQEHFVVLYKKIYLSS